jgi:hypothetical protein
MLDSSVRARREGGANPKESIAVNRLLRLAAAAALAATLIVPGAAFAVDPTPTPLPSPSATPAPSAAPVSDANLPVPEADLMESIRVEYTSGRLGASISPSSLIFTDVDGKGGIVRILNPSDQLLAVKVYARDYTIDANGEVAVDENGEPTTGIPNYQYASADWYTFSYTGDFTDAKPGAIEFLLPAGRALNLPFQVEVPPAAAPGDHTAAFIAMIRKADLESSSEQINIGYTSVFRFLVRLQHRVAGAEAKEPTVKVSTIIEQSRRIDLIATVDNEGTTVLDYKPYKEDDPRPVFRVKRADNGELVREFSVVKGFYVLPEGNRIVTVSWRDADLTEPTGSAAEIARLEADSKTATDRDELAIINSKLLLAKKRSDYNTALAALDPALADAVGAVRAALATWYDEQRAGFENAVPLAAVQAEASRLAAEAAQQGKFAVSAIAPAVALAADDVQLAGELRVVADSAALPLTGDYVVEFVLPKRGGIDEVIASTTFSFQNADPTKTLPSASAPLLLVAVALAAGLAGVVGVLAFARRRRSDEISAE